jgi:hypothetical protein
MWHPTALPSAAPTTPHDPSNPTGAFTQYHFSQEPEDRLAGIRRCRTHRHPAHARSLFTAHLAHRRRHDAGPDDPLSVHLEHRNRTGILREAAQRTCRTLGLDPPGCTAAAAFTAPTSG